MEKVKIKKPKLQKLWIENEYIQEFDIMSECYAQNFPPLNLKKYEGDRNFHFYELQNKLIENYNATGKTDDAILWEMFPYIEGVCGSIAKKFVATGCRVPDFEGKVLESALKVQDHYRNQPYFRAKKLENYAYKKVQEVFYDPNLQLNERMADYDQLSNYEHTNGEIINFWR